MEPVSREEAIKMHKERVAPNAALDCRHCGLWKVQIMESVEEQWMCAIDQSHRFCGGKCSQFQEKPKPLWKKIKEMIKS
jgi:hypothetical protein